jgi:hypothetical protein
MPGATADATTAKTASPTATAAKSAAPRPMTTAKSSGDTPSGVKAID